MSIMEKKYKFIVNPASGQGAGKLALPELDRIAKAFSLRYEIISTEYPGHAIELAELAAGEQYSYVIAVGGDGTSNEVLNGLMRAWKNGYTETTMGILGVGRGNDFAFGFGISPGLDEGFKVIQNNQARLVDVGLITGGDFPQGRYFGNGIGIGFDAVVGFEAAKLTRLHGFTNYVVAALRTIFLYFHAPMLKIDYDQSVITLPALMVSIMNGRRMGGGFMMAPNALTDDGLLDLCVAGQVSRMGILMLIPKFMKGTQANHPQVKTIRAARVRVQAIEGVLPAHADGETICVAGKELVIELIKQPIKILCGYSDT
jgi:YegS/Rv2252/BmrU family lipid kinase